MEVKRFRVQFLIIRHFLYSPYSQKHREDEERHDWIDSSQLKTQDHLKWSFTVNSLQHKGKQQASSLGSQF